jgi:hypothetical protein
MAKEPEPAEAAEPEAAAKILTGMNSVKAINPASHQTLKQS